MKGGSQEERGKASDSGYCGWNLQASMLSEDRAASSYVLCAAGDLDFGYRVLPGMPVPGTHQIRASHTADADG